VKYVHDLKSESESENGNESENENESGDDCENDDPCCATLNASETDDDHDEQSRQ